MKKVTGIITFIFLATTASAAQPILPIINNQAPQSAPIDGGLLYLALAGGTYAVMKMFSRRKHER